MVANPDFIYRPPMSPYLDIIYQDEDIVVINKPLINTWIFKTLRHPNYIVVFLEVLTVCLIFNDYISLFIFSTFNTILIFIRIYFEEKANSFRRKSQ